jgi:putative salt-induced outer membrane protein YdiY
MAVALLSGGVMVLGQSPDPAPEKIPVWEKSASVGLTLTRGNSETLLATANILAAKKWQRNELSLGADGTYGETKLPGATDSTKNAESLHGFIQYNRLFTERLYGYGRIDALHDAVADIEYRLTFSPGAGYYFIKNENTKLSAEAGPAFILEKLGSADEHGYFTLRLAERFEQKISDRARIWQSAEILPQVDDFDNYLINAELGIEADLTKDKRLALRSFIQDSYDNVPAPGRKRNDLKWVTAIAYKF